MVVPIGNSNVSVAQVTSYCICSWIRIRVQPFHRMVLHAITCFTLLHSLTHWLLHSSHRLHSSHLRHSSHGLHSSHRLHSSHWHATHWLLIHTRHLLLHHRLLHLIGGAACCIIDSCIIDCCIICLCTSWGCI